MLKMNVPIIGFFRHVYHCRTFKGKAGNSSLLRGCNQWNQQQRKAEYFYSVHDIKLKFLPHTTVGTYIVHMVFGSKSYPTIGHVKGQCFNSGL